MPRGFRALPGHVRQQLPGDLQELDFQWSSNQVINPMGWRYINRDYDRGEPWHRTCRPTPIVQGVTEIPMHSEYTWYLETDDVDRHFALARDDFERRGVTAIPFVVLSHYYAMTGQWAPACTFTNGSLPTPEHRETCVL